jgi:uncharacterized RDD family membrane protein YckC
MPGQRIAEAPRHQHPRATPGGLQRAADATRYAGSGTLAATSPKPDRETTGASAGTPDKHEPLDCAVKIITPERISLLLPLAGPARRFVAYLLDQLLLAVLVLVAVVVALVLAMGSIAGMGPALVAYFVLNWGYGAFCEGVLNGQTLGKRVMGIRVVSERGIAITGFQAVIRNLVGVVDGLFPFFYQAGLVSMILSGRFQRLGDLAAGTIVVIEERRASRPITRVSNADVDALLPWLPRRIAAGSNLARVVSDYVEQRRRFTAARRAEMAEHLARPLRARYDIAASVPADVVLCAFYHRVFLDD